MKYDKIIKWILAALFVIGVVVTAYGYIAGFESNNAAPVNVLLYCTYAFATIAILAVVFGVVVIGGINNPKSLIKLGVGLVAIVAIVAVAYLLAEGSQPIGYLGEPVADGTLKLTDTVLNLTYFAVVASLLALVASWIIGAVRK